MTGVEAKAVLKVQVEADFVSADGERIPLNMNHSWRGWFLWLRRNIRGRYWQAVRINLTSDLWKTVKATFRSKQ